MARSEDLDLVGKKLRNIQVLERLGKGGMGVVYLGFDETLERKVALKAIRRSAALTPEIKTRFLREARVLSQLEHPHICRIYDFLEVEDQEILVLEHLEGETLTKASKRGLSPRLRLEIAIQLAEVLAAAHGAGIVHRDLKPDNVMCRGDGYVKVLDFGLARPLTSHPLVTEGVAGEGGAGDWREGQWSPPEEDSALTRLVDEDQEPTEPALRPYPMPEQQRQGTAEASGQETVAHSAPRSPGPATRDSASGASSGAGSGASGSSSQPSGTHVSDVTRAGSVVGTISYMSPEQARGEALTTASDIYSLGIILHELFTGESAYEKSVSDLVKLQRVAQGDTRPLRGVDPELADLIRQLEDPSPARRPRAVDVVERLRRFRERPARRRRHALALGVMLALLAAGVKYTVDLRHERQRALGAVDQAERAREEAEQVSRFLVGVFELADPRRARGRDITAREILDEGVARLEDLEHQPEAQGRLLSTVGEVYYKLGYYHEAKTLLGRALAAQERVSGGGDDTELATTLARLGETCRFLDEYACARELLGKALAMRRRLHPGGHPELAASLLDLGRLSYDEGRLEESVGFLEESAAMLRPVAASSASGGGSGRARSTGLGRTETAEAEVLADTLRLLGKCLVDMGETERAEKLLLESVALYEEHLGDDHPSLAIALEDLGFVYHDQALYDQARPAMERSLRIREKVFGPHHQSLAISSSYLASIAAAEGRFDEAETLLRRSVDIFSARLGPDHFNVGAALIFLADVFLQVGRLEAAEEAYERSLEIAGGLDVEASYNGLTARQGLGHVALARGRWRLAREHLEASVEPFVSVVGEASTEVVTSLIGLVRACHALGLRSEADRWLERADRASEQLVAAAPESPSALRARAEVELAMGAAAEARQAGSGRQRFETANRRLESLPGADREVHLQALRAEAMLRLGRDASELLAALERLGWADPFLWQLAGPGGAAETVASGR